MSKNKKTLFIIFLLFIASGSWVLFNQPNLNKAPDISFNTINGQKLSLHALRGKPVLLTFWATDCPGCIKEIPHLLALHRDYAAKGLTIVAVAMYYDPPENVIAMSKEKQLTYPIVLDKKAEISKAFGNIRLTPTNFLISPNGSIAMQKIGEFDETDMRKRLDKMMRGS